MTSFNSLRHLNDDGQARTPTTFSHNISQTSDEELARALQEQFALEDSLQDQRPTATPAQQAQRPAPPPKVDVRQAARASLVAASDNVIHSVVSLPFLFGVSADATREALPAGLGLEQAVAEAVHEFVFEGTPDTLAHHTSELDRLTALSSAIGRATRTDGALHGSPLHEMIVGAMRSVAVMVPHEANPARPSPPQAPDANEVFTEQEPAALRAPALTPAQVAAQTRRAALRAGANHAVANMMSRIMLEDAEPRPDFTAPGGQWVSNRDQAVFDEVMDFVMAGAPPDARNMERFIALERLIEHPLPEDHHLDLEQAAVVRAALQRVPTGMIYESNAANLVHRPEAVQPLAARAIGLHRLGTDVATQARNLGTINLMRVYFAHSSGYLSELHAATLGRVHNLNLRTWTPRSENSDDAVLHEAAAHMHDGAVGTVDVMFTPPGHYTALAIGHAVGERATQGEVENFTTHMRDYGAGGHCMIFSLLGQRNLHQFREARDAYDRLPETGNDLSNYAAEIETLERIIRTHTPDALNPQADVRENFWAYANRLASATRSAIVRDWDATLSGPDDNLASTRVEQITTQAMEEAYAAVDAVGEWFQDPETTALMFSDDERVQQGMRFDLAEHVLSEDPQALATLREAREAFGF